MSKNNDKLFEWIICLHATSTSKVMFMGLSEYLFSARQTNRVPQARVMLASCRIGPSTCIAEMKTISKWKGTCFHINQDSGKMFFLPDTCSLCLYLGKLESSMWFPS